MNISISYFREFVVLASTQSYWAAADQLFIGESSLSKHIKQLEKQLGAALFVRNCKKVELTDFGKKLLPYAKAIAKLQNDYETMTYNYLRNGTETLNIALIPVIPHYKLTSILLQLQNDFPMVQVNTTETDTIAIRDMLIEHKCDIGIYRDHSIYLEHDPDKEIQLVKIPFCEDRLVAVLPLEHPLAGAGQIELAQLAQESFVLIKKGSMPYLLVERACRKAGFVPRVLFTSHNLEAVLDMVSKGGCVSLLFANHVTFARDVPNGGREPFAVVPVSPPIVSKLYIAYLKDAALSDAAAHFIHYCTMARENSDGADFMWSTPETKTWNHSETESLNTEM